MPAQLSSSSKRLALQSMMQVFVIDLTKTEVTKAAGGRPTGRFLASDNFVREMKT